MTWTLISARPSPYARKVRIALAEKNIPFTLQTEVPWDSTTQTPQYNPLEKLPVLILDDGKTPVYESHFILEWLEAKHPDPPMLPAASEVDERLFAKQVEVVCDGMCDALVLALFENRREEGMRSEPWAARYDDPHDQGFAIGSWMGIDDVVHRQMRKAEGALRQLNVWVNERGNGKYLIGGRLTLADLAAGSALGWLSLRWPDYHWQEEYPAMKKYWEGLEELESFKNTRPEPQTMKDRIV
jgi:glutathione S-transferase